MSIVQRIRSYLPVHGGPPYGMELKRVPPDVKVAVTHDQNPIAGIEVTVVRVDGSGPVFAGVTDELGQVSIRGLAAGEYFLAASHLGFEAGSERIEVVPAAHKTTTNHFDFAWDSDYQVRRIAGTLAGIAPGRTGNDWMDIVHPVRAVYGGVAITLRNAFGRDEYRTVSNRNGEFLIDHVPDGIFVLTIEGGEAGADGTADVTRRLVDVRSSTPRDDLPLELRETAYDHSEFELCEK